MEENVTFNKEEKEIIKQAINTVVQKMNFFGEEENTRVEKESSLVIPNGNERLTYKTAEGLEIGKITKVDNGYYIISLLQKRMEDKNINHVEEISVEGNISKNDIYKVFLNSIKTPFPSNYYFNQMELIMEHKKVLNPTSDISILKYWEMEATTPILVKGQIVDTLMECFSVNKHFLAPFTEVIHTEEDILQYLNYTIPTPSIDDKVSVEKLYTNLNMNKVTKTTVMTSKYNEKLTIHITKNKESDKLVFIRTDSRLYRGIENNWQLFICPNHYTLEDIKQNINELSDELMNDLPSQNSENVEEDINSGKQEITSNYEKTPEDLMHEQDIEWWKHTLDVDKAINTSKPILNEEVKHDFTFYNGDDRKDLGSIVFSKIRPKPFESKEDKDNFNDLSKSIFNKVSKEIAKQGTKATLNTLSKTIVKGANSTIRKLSNQTEEEINLKLAIRKFNKVHTKQELMDIILEEVKNLDK